MKRLAGDDADSESRNKVVKAIACSAEALISLEQLNNMHAVTFEAELGGIYEKSPWVSRAAANMRPVASVRALADAMAAAVDSSEEDAKLKLLHAYSDLASIAALVENVTRGHPEKWAHAGLARCTEEESKRFTMLSGAYREKFGWPCIVAVQSATKSSILASCERRLKNDACAERAESLTQVHKIAYIRLLGKVKHAPTGFLTCHVLDTTRGCPAAGMRLTLRRLDKESFDWQTLGVWVANSDGRLPCGRALEGDEHRTGVYEWTFSVGEYFAAVGVQTNMRMPFLDEVPVRFTISDPESHYHVPLLVSPAGYSTYRGS